MSRATPGPTERRRRLLDDWERRCRAQGDPGRCSGADALFLVSALSNALRSGGGTPELGRAARTWGAGFAAPVEALSAVVQLRAAVASTLVDAAEGVTVFSPAIANVFDQIMMEAVDAASANLRSAARIDSLTGCANRRAFDEELGHALASARRSALELTVAIVDLDGLKAINDSRGHAAGDATLVSLVATLRRVLREADTLYRTGGDEFVVLTPFTDVAGARALMRRAEQMSGPEFSWGVASTLSLHSAGEAGATADDATEADSGNSGSPGSLDAEAVSLLAAADFDLYARRRARRQAAIRTRRKRRAIAVASVAASAATVASGAGLAAALAGGWLGSSPQRPGTAQALHSRGTGVPPAPLRLGPLRRPTIAPSPGAARAPASIAASARSGGGPAAAVAGEATAVTVSAAHLEPATGVVSPSPTPPPPLGARDVGSGANHPPGQGSSAPALPTSSRAPGPAPAARAASASDKGVSPRAPSPGGAATGRATGGAAKPKG